MGRPDTHNTGVRDHNGRHWKRTGASRQSADSPTAHIEKLASENALLPGGSLKNRSGAKADCNMTGEERGSQNRNKINVNKGEKFASAGGLTYTIAGYHKCRF
jgi:hypothetical protein